MLEASSDSKVRGLAPEPALHRQLQMIVFQAAAGAPCATAATDQLARREFQEKTSSSPLKTK